MWLATPQLAINFPSAVAKCVRCRSTEKVWSWIIPFRDSLQSLLCEISAKSRWSKWVKTSPWSSMTYRGPTVLAKSWTFSSTQQHFCLSSIKNSKKQKVAGPFNQPVDPVASNIPRYPSIGIKNPMDFSAIFDQTKIGPLRSPNRFPIQAMNRPGGSRSLGLNCKTEICLHFFIGLPSSMQTQLEYILCDEQEV